MYIREQLGLYHYKLTMVNILAGLSLAVAVQLVASCCGPVKMQGYEHVSSGLMINGVGISAKVLELFLYS